MKYAVGGLYSRVTFKNSYKAAFLLSIVPVLSERLLVYLIGRWFYLSGGDGTITADYTVMNFIQAEAAPYYTILYIILGVVSIAITMVIAEVRGEFFAKN